MKHGKKYNESAKLIETGKFYDVNEAVEIAKKFGQEESAGFVNGVLAKLV